MKRAVHVRHKDQPTYRVDIHGPPCKVCGYEKKAGVHGWSAGHEYVPDHEFKDRSES